MMFLYNLYKIQDHIWKYQVCFKIVISNILPGFTTPPPPRLWRLTLPSGKVVPQPFFIKMTPKDVRDYLGALGHSL